MTGAIVLEDVGPAVALVDVRLDPYRQILAPSPRGVEPRRAHRRLAGFERAPHRARLHASLDRRGARRGARARDHRGGGGRRHHGVRHCACIRARRRRARSQRAVAGTRPLVVRRGHDRPNRDEGRDGAAGRRLGAGRSGEDDPGGLRGEPRRARRPADRPLPRPCAGSADAVADDRAGACAARRRSARPARRRGQREPAAARRGARACADRGRAGGAQPARRPCAPWRRGRAVRGGRDPPDRPFAARRAAAQTGARASRAARRGRAEAPCDARRGRARVAARARAGPRRDPGRANAGGGAVGPAGCRPRAGRHRSRAPLPGVRRAVPSARAATAGDRRGGRARDGYPGRGQEPRRRGLRRAWLRPPQPGRARRVAAGARGRPRRGPVGRRPQVGARQHLPHARLAEPRARGRRPARCDGRVRLGGHLARAGAGEPRRAAPRTARRPAFARGAPRAGPPRAGRPRAHLPDACAPGARAAVGGRGLRADLPARVRAGDDPGPDAAGALRRPRRAGVRGLAQRGATDAARHARAALRLGPGRPRAGPRRGRRRARGGARPTGRDGALPARRRTADLLVPSAAPRAPARIRASARGRPCGLGPGRNEPRAPDMAETLGARYVEATTESPVRPPESREGLG